MESQNKFQVSRRTLLKDTAIGAAGVSTMGIADIASAASKKPVKKLTRLRPPRSATST